PSLSKKKLQDRHRLRAVDEQHFLEVDFESAVFLAQAVKAASGPDMLRVAARLHQHEIRRDFILGDIDVRDDASQFWPGLHVGASFAEISHAVTKLAA